MNLSGESTPRPPMKLRRRDFLIRSAAMAAVSSLPSGLVRAEANTPLYPYLGRTEDYADFHIIDPGLTITSRIVDAWPLWHRPRYHQ